MSQQNTFSHVPESITFGSKILQMPTLEEVGIPMGAFGFVKRSDGLEGGGYDPCWINRGDLLLTYDFRFFQNEDKSFFSKLGADDPVWHATFEIVSPISGLLLLLREEQTVDFTLGLQYEGCTKRALPVILVPNDEPPPDKRNFYTYDQIASQLSSYFYMIPFRDRSKTSPERLRDWIARNSNVAEAYQGYRDALQNRERDGYREYEIREMSGEDKELISMVQHLRGKDVLLRDKLVHLARKYGESI